MSTRRATAANGVASGLVGSVLLHVGIFVAALVTWQHTLDIAEQPSQVVPVDLVTVSDKTNVAPMVKEAAAPLPQPDMIQPQDQPAPVEPKFEVAPTIPKPAPVIAPAPPKKEQFDINNIMAMLDKKQAAATAKNARTGNQNIKGIGAQSAMTADLRSMLQSEIYKCWSPPVGAPHPEKLIVSYELFLTRDGNVAQPPQLTADSSMAASSDPYMRAAAEAARRAIYTCAPYKLPADRYGQWNDVTFMFDPRIMMGQ